MPPAPTSPSGATEGAEGLFHSLRRLLELPDGVEVFPGHVAGSLCGKAMSSKASTTIGFERRFNPMLSLLERDAFVAESAAIGAPKPPNLGRIVALNQGPFLGAAPAATQIAAAPPGDAAPRRATRRRPPPGHVHGAVSVPVSGSSFATKAGFVLDADQSVTVLAGRRRGASVQLPACAPSAFSTSRASPSAAGPSDRRRWPWESSTGSSRTAPR